MGAGLGFKTFVTGDVLTAADTNGYLMQGTWVFASAAARAAAVTSPQEGNMSYLKDTNSTEYYSGSAWVAVAATGGFNLINRTSFSNVASTTTSFDNVFSSTYETYMIVVEGIYSAVSDDMQIQMRYAGPTTQVTNYYGMSYGAAFNAAALTFKGQSNTSQLTLWDSLGAVNYGSQGVITITQVGNGARRPYISGYAMNGDNNYGPSNFGGFLDASQTFTGFLLKSSSSNITGSVAVYGLAKA